MPPASKAGEFEYSNLGFIIAGAIAEARTGKSWEDLIREQIFAPLGIKNAGFGPPGTPGQDRSTLGTSRTRPGKLDALDPANPDGDNPPALGPAGTINIALKDWLLFAQDQLDGVHGRGKLLKAGNLSQTAHAGDGELRIRLGREARAPTACRCSSPIPAATASGSPTSASCPSTT